MCWCLTITCVNTVLRLQFEVSMLYILVIWSGGKGFEERVGGTSVVHYLCFEGIRVIDDSNFIESIKESKSVWKGG